MVDIREKEPSLLGLDSKAPGPIKAFSRFMIWQYPNETARKEAVNALVRRTMQLVSLLTALLSLYLASVITRLESKLPERVFIIEAPVSVDAGADQ